VCREAAPQGLLNCPTPRTLRSADQALIDEIAAWVDNHNARYTKADWHFTTTDVRMKLKHLYPTQTTRETSVISNRCPCKHWRQGRAACIHP
jgi:hypothetical protein